MKAWKIGYEIENCGGWVDYEWVDGETEREAKRLFKENQPDDKIVSVEERVDFMKLQDEACRQILEKVRPTKHLEIDDVRWADDRLTVPVWDVRTYNGNGFMGGASPACEFFFHRIQWESEAEMVERFGRELSEFVGRNWKRLDK